METLNGNYNVLRAYRDEDDILDKVNNTVMSEEKKSTMVRGMLQTVS